MYDTDLWFINNAVDTAAVTGDSAAPELSPQRLRDPRLGVVWRPRSDTPAVVTIDFAIPTRVDVVGLFGLGATVNQSFQLTLTTTMNVVDPRSGVWNPSVDEYARQVIWLADPDVASPLISRLRIEVLGDRGDIGRIWAGPLHWAPEISHVYGSEQSVFDLSVVQRAARSGAVFADSAVKLRGMTLTYDAISPDERNNQVRQIEMRTGISKQMLFVPNPSVYSIEHGPILGYSEVINPIAIIGFNRTRKMFTLKESG